MNSFSLSKKGTLAFLFAMCFVLLSCMVAIFSANFANTQMPAVQISAEGEEEEESYTSPAPDTSQSAYLLSDWFSKTGLQRYNIYELHITTELPEGVTTVGSCSVAAKDIDGTAFDNTTPDITAYWTSTSSGAHMYLVCEYQIYAPRNCFEFFYNFRSLDVLNLHNFNTSYVENMSSMFDSNEDLIALDLSNFDTSKVTNMVALGVLSSVVEFVDTEYLALGFKKVMGEKKKDLLPLNKRALEAGFKAISL